MRIQNNIMAMNAYRNYTNNTSALSKNLEKLSSGYKINRAGDDAAGLAISEKMRAQITGLEGAQKNAKDGISLVQTAEGALTEVHDMLNRMYSLAEQSANGTYENETDRAQLQKEVKNLKDEINRIADSSNFNGIKLLNGDLAGPMVEQTVGTAPTGAAAPTITAATGGLEMTATDGDGASTAAKIEFDVAGMSIKAPTDGSTGSKVKFTIGGQEVEIDVAGDMDDTAIANALNTKEITLGSKKFTASVSGTTVTFTAEDNTSLTTAVTDLNGTNASAAGVAGTAANATGTASTATIDFSNYTGANLIGGSMTIGNTTYSFVEKAEDAAAGTTAIEIAKDATAEEIAQAIVDATADNTAATGALDASGTKVVLTEVAGGGGTFSGEKIAVSFEGAGGLMLQIGDTSDSYNQLAVRISDCHTDQMGIGEGSNDTIADIDIGTQAGAKAALKTIENAINYVSDVRGTLGATQNRLDHTINNLSVMQENIQDAESTIRDTDVAEEMMSYTKNNILIQSAQAMLAQANQVPQGVLQLLQ